MRFPLVDLKWEGRLDSVPPRQSSSLGKYLGAEFDRKAGNISLSSIQGQQAYHKFRVEIEASGAKY